MKALLQLKKYLLVYKSGYGWGVLALIGTSIFGSFVPWLIQYPIDILKTEEFEFKPFLLSIFLFLIAALFTGVCRYFMRQTLIGISRKVEYDFRNDLFKHLQNLSLSFYHQFRTGDIMARATNDMNAVRTLVGPGIMYSLNTVFYTIFAVSMMFQIDVKLSLLAIIPLPILSVAVNRTMKYLYRFSNRVQGIFSDLTSMTQENLSGIRVIKAYNQEQNQIARFNKISNDYLKNNLKLSLFRGGMYAGISLLIGLGMVIILYFGGRDVIFQRISLGQFVSFNTYLLTLAWPMIAVGWVINIFQMGSASLDRINEYFNIEPQIKDFEKTDVTIKQFNGDLELRHVYFKYNPDSDFVLRDINASINSGDLIAIVGTTGSGKTSLVNVITRLYDVQRGNILFGNHSIQKIPIKTLRKSIGLVPQEDFLFSETIAENIAFGKSKFLENEVKTVANQVEIAAEIEEFDNKYNTLLGERGINVSGGQKQRIAIARAILKQPKILVLDDALSAVDTITEQNILKNLKNDFPEMTKIIISHRVTTLKDADQIFVLHDGQIVESGKHAELIALDGQYADLYFKQLIREELERIE